MKPTQEPDYRVYKAGQDFIQDNTPLLVRGYIFNEILGRLLTVIEAMGVPTKQEEAVKSYIRQAVWQPLDNSIGILSAEMDNKLCAVNGQGETAIK